MQLPSLTQCFPDPQLPPLLLTFLIRRKNNYSHAKENPRFKQLFPCSLPSSAWRRGHALAGCVRQLIAQEIRVTHCQAVLKLLILNRELPGLGNALEGSTAPREGPSRDPERGAGSDTNNTSLPNGKRFLSRPPRVPPAHRPCPDIGPILVSRFPRHDGCSVQQFCFLSEQRKADNCQSL